MTNLNRWISWMLPLIFPHVAWCGSAILFDRPELIAFDDNGYLAGYYASRDSRRSCAFSFYQVGAEAERRPQPYSEVQVLTFIPKANDFSFDGINKVFDIKGELYRRGGTWIIRTDQGQAGCENALGLFTSFPADKVGGEIFSVKGKFSAIGIRLVRRRSRFYDLQNERFIIRKRYLAPGDGVIVLRARGRFSYVRFSDPRQDTGGRVTTGWIDSADLVDQFPSTAGR